MQDVSIAEMDLFTDLIGLFAEMPWPTMLLAADGRILALSTLMRELLGADAAPAIGQPLEVIGGDRYHGIANLAPPADGDESALADDEIKTAWLFT